MYRITLTARAAITSAAFALLLLTSCGGAETPKESTTPAKPEAKETPEPATTPSAAVKDKFYTFTYPEIWGKPVGAGSSSIYSIKLKECTCSWIENMVNPVKAGWVADINTFTIAQHLDRVEADHKAKSTRTINEKKEVTINSVESGFVEYAQAATSGTPPQIARTYLFKKENVVVSILVSATEKCWEKYLPEAEKVLATVVML